RTWIGETIFLRPARTGPRAEDWSTLHPRRRRPLDACQRVAKLEKISRPRQRQPHQVGVVTEAGLRVRAGGDHDAFVRDDFSPALATHRTGPERAANRFRPGWLRGEAGGEQDRDRDQQEGSHTHYGLGSPFANSGRVVRA